MQNNNFRLLCKCIDKYIPCIAEEFNFVHSTYTEDSISTYCRIKENDRGIDKNEYNFAAAYVQLIYYPYKCKFKIIEKHPYYGETYTTNINSFNNLAESLKQKLQQIRDFYSLRENGSRNPDLIQRIETYELERKQQF